MRTNRLQNRITMGRFTLPIVVVASMVCWALAAVLLPAVPKEPGSYPLWHDFRALALPGWGVRGLSFLLYAVIGYFLIEFNNTFAFIRVRASVQTSFYFALISACPGLHLLYAGDVASLALVLSLYFLFKSYQQPRSGAGLLLLSGAAMGAGSVFFPQLTLLFPLWLVGAYHFQSLSRRSFCAAVTGWSLPYWFLFAYALVEDRMELFYNPFVELITFQPIRFAGTFEAWELATLGYLLVMFVVSASHSLKASHEDRIRTRAYLRFLIALGACTFVYIPLQPMHAVNLLSPLVLVVSLLMGHYFVLTNSRSSNWVFIGSLVGLIALLIFNAWTLS